MWKGEKEGTGRVKLQGVLLNKVKEYRYLGSYMADGGDLDREVERKVQAGWCKWREASGILCDRRVPLKLKGKYYSTVVRPAMIYFFRMLGLKEEAGAKTERGRNEDAENDVWSDKKGQSEKRICESKCGSG